MNLSLLDIRDGTSVFIDANIFVYYFTENSRFNPSCTGLLERVEKGEIHGITTASVIQEVTHRIMVEEAAILLHDIKIRDLVKYLKTHHETVKKLTINCEIPSKIALLDIEIIPVDMRVVERSQRMKTRYGFLSNDALILQVMEDSNITHLASNDSDFERVDFITLYKPL